MAWKTTSPLFQQLLMRLRLMRKPLLQDMFPPDPPEDPFAWKPVRVRPRPTGRTGSVAVAEPDDN